MNKFVDFTGTRFVPDLLPIIPHGARLSKGGKVTRDHLGKTPGLFNTWTRTWSALAWRSHIMRDDQLPAIDGWYADRPCSTIAVQAGTLCALDCNLGNAQFAEVAERIGRRVLGWGPKRISAGSHKFLLCFRHKSSDPFIHTYRLAIEHEVFGPSLGSQAIEFRGMGQQWLMSGEHPSGSFYTWERLSSGINAGPLDFGGDNIPIVTNKQVGQFFAKLQVELAKVFWVNRPRAKSYSTGARCRSRKWPALTNGSALSLR